MSGRCLPDRSNPTTPGSQNAPSPHCTKIFIQRDYSEGTSVKFQTRFPPELEDRIERQQFEHTMERLNEHFEMAESADCSTYCEGCLACLTAYFIYVCTETHYEKMSEHVFRGHTGSVDQLCWHATHADLLSTASGDKTVRIWDTRTHKCSATIPTKGENINIAWSPNGSTIAVGNKEDLVSFIDTRTHKIVEEQFNFEVNEISWNNTSDLFYLTNGQGCVHILSYPGLELQTILKAHPGTCICIEHDPTGRYFATGSADTLVSLWDVKELACLRVFSRLEWPVRTLSFSFDGRLLASASEDLVIDIGDTESGEKVADILVAAATFTVAWHPSLYLLAYACDDKEPERKRDAGTLKVWGFANSG